MECIKRLVNEIAYAYTPSSSQTLSKLSPLQISLIPLLSLASSLYRLSIFFRHHLYQLGFFYKHRLPVPVISVGNLTWGGNGKTPMVEFLARWFSESRISPLILTRGYAGGDEAKMLERHLLATSAKVGVGANRAATAAHFFEKYGYEDLCDSAFFQGLSANHKARLISNVDKIGIVILDDGMQHWSLFRDLEIVMINGTMPWGNKHLLPLGPLREPLAALERADIAVIHHADMVSDRELKLIEFTIREVNETLPIFLARLTPSCLFEVDNCDSKFPLLIMQDTVVLCVSAIGSANAFVQAVEKLGPLYVDRLDFSDHHLFKAKLGLLLCRCDSIQLSAAVASISAVTPQHSQGTSMSYLSPEQLPLSLSGTKDIEMIKERLREVQDGFGVKPVVVVTEKDYDRDSAILKGLSPFKVLVLCSHLQIIPKAEYAEEKFKKLLKQILNGKISGR